MKTFYEKDADVNLIKNKKVAIFGYGSQGHAHALNLKDSGVKEVVVALREGSSSVKKAESEGLKVMSLSDAAAWADVVMMLTPDELQSEIYKNHIEQRMKEGTSLAFAHGLNIHYDLIKARDDLDVFLIAPKGPGGLVRRQYKEGHGVPCLVAIEHDKSGEALDLALAYAHGIGGARAGVIETTFAEETETDLFGEQAILCGGATELVVAGYETLVEAGYQPEVAYYECMHELKLIVDLLHEGGLKKMHEFISDTAAYGDLVSGPRVIDEHARKKMKDILDDIQTGKFAENWINENEAGQPEFKRMMNNDLEHPIEKVGTDLRSRMDWLEK